jgi:UDP-N-acetylglucosamine acyltransferase
MSEKLIHPTAIVHEGSEIGENVKIGPFCIIGPKVKIGNNNILHASVYVEGSTTIGEGNEFFPYSCIGTPPQDLTYNGEDTELIIGNQNLFREGVNIHRATTKQDLKTIIGNNNYFMSHVHIAHDCNIGNHVILASQCAIAGHVTIHEKVSMGGQCGVTPFMTVGKNVFVGGATTIDKDVPHYTTCFGNRIRLKGVNIIGLKRRGVAKDIISEVVDFYRSMESSAFSPKAFVERDEFMLEYSNNPIIKEMTDFISGSQIGIPPFMS